MKPFNFERTFLVIFYSIKPFHTYGFAALTVAGVVTITSQLAAAVVRTPDANTVLLWRFEETAASVGVDVQDSHTNDIDGRGFDDGVDNATASVDFNEP